jgi:hypothetical protein
MIFKNVFIPGLGLIISASVWAVGPANDTIGDDALTFMLAYRDYKEQGMPADQALSNVRKSLAKLKLFDVSSLDDNKLKNKLSQMRVAMFCQDDIGKIEIFDLQGNLLFEGTGTLAMYRSMADTCVPKGLTTEWTEIRPATAK